jgi:hypothetical protein
MEKNIVKGERTYDSFCGMFKGFRVSTPRTTTLELFALLKERGENEILLRVMMEEFISNLNDVKVFAEKGKLFIKYEYVEKF